jgi:VanZ family protein
MTTLTSGALMLARPCETRTDTIRCAPVTSRRLPHVLLAAYVAFLVYGSFFPFEFHFDSATLRHGLDHAVVGLHDGRGHRTISAPDFVSNILLGVPFGLLMVCAGLAGASLPARTISVGLLDLGLAAAIEAGQLFTPDRTASVLDVAAQLIGSVVGVLVAHALRPDSAVALGPRLANKLRREPALATLLVLAIVAAADALYPYAVTLDISTVWENVKHVQWLPSSSLRRRASWADFFVQKVGLYSALGALAQVALRAYVAARRRLWAWIGLTALATALEGAKLFIVGRAPDVDSVLLAAAGALLGVTAVPALAGTAAVRAHWQGLLVAAAIALIAYEELTPFDFSLTASAIHAKTTRIEWLPFTSYYVAHPQAALLDFGTKLFLGALLGGALRVGFPRVPLVSVLGLSTILEAAQLLQTSHTTAVTDVISLYVGGRLGSHLITRYLADSR